jgi:hypothetical protein
VGKARMPRPVASRGPLHDHLVTYCSTYIFTRRRATRPGSDRQHLLQPPGKNCRDRSVSRISSSYLQFYPRFYISFILVLHDFYRILI